MNNTMNVSFPGGKMVNARYDGLEIATDQAVDSGGTGSAPEPFDYFLASLATCAGIYVLGFCQKRDIPHGGISLTQSWEREERQSASPTFASRSRSPPTSPTNTETPLSAWRISASSKKRWRARRSFSLRRLRWRPLAVRYRL